MFPGGTPRRRQTARSTEAVQDHTRNFLSVSEIKLIPGKVFAKLNAIPLEN
jgi:hypothetical protein